MEKDIVALLSEELTLQKRVANESLEHTNALIMSARKTSSQYQREAEKCNAAMETCEEARERAEKELREECRLAELWEKRAREQGWKDDIRRNSFQDHKKLTTGKLVSLSEQEVVDCDVKGVDEGCNGGLMDDAFKFIQQNKGLTTEANYPYKGVDGTCNAKKEANHAANINGFEDVPSNNEKALLKAVAHQPVSVAIDAGEGDFQFYSSGVFTGTCGTDLDHGVTAVGYGVNADGTKYWLVKNSWGTGWGEEGYIRMQRDVDAKEGLCGIAMQASYPTA
ncbi:hypothetical protein ACOSQ3_002240 [Xanthoceras sorbifolium]